jgi:hypothetical protein
MAIHGISYFGPPTLYGYSAPPQFTVDPFVAVPQDYSTIMLSWAKPSGTITAWRLVKNMNGWPADQDDGSIVVDSAVGFPGRAYADISVTPGAYHYYGFFVQVNVESNLWVCAGVTGCLMINNYGSSTGMLNLIPDFFINLVNETDLLQADPSGNPYLTLLMSVFGWGLDYLRTQYDTYLNFNNSLNIPIDDLYNLALELGIDINPAISPYTLRKAVYYNATVNKNKGTTLGIGTELAALTGWSADVTIGPNLMLSDDQSFFQNPVIPEWNDAINYNDGELVQYDSFVYLCIDTSHTNYGHSPSGTTSANSWWEVQQYQPSTVLNNSVTGGIDTWEGIYSLTPSTTLPSNALEELIGAQDPLSILHNSFNVLQLENLNSSTTDLWLRSVARTPADMAQSYPDQYQAIADGIPVPSYLTASVWSATVTYYLQEIVLYNTQPFMALRTSVNSVPPYTTAGEASEDWTPLGYDERFRIVTSTYARGSALTIVPFIEWYDSAGHFITRVFARNTGTQPSLPAGICYDSFVTGTGETLSSYSTTDDGTYSWSNAAGSFTISPFAGGCAYPTNQATRSISVVNTGSANCQTGLTFITNPTESWTTGLVLRYSSSVSYLEATMTSLVENNSGSFSVLGTYSTPCIAGDRVLVVLNGNYITVYRNGVSVLIVSTTFNNTATSFGIVYEQI